MNDPGRMSTQCWAGFDCSHLKDCLKDHPAMKLMDMVAERDAAMAERDTAMAEKKTAFVERDAALLQRDVAYADRNAAWMDRDATLAVLAMIRVGKENSSQGLSTTGQGKKQGNNKKSKLAMSAGQSDKDSAPQSKRKRKQKALQDLMIGSEKNWREATTNKVPDTLMAFFPSDTPHPYCSCTGTNQQCYRWGKGGWQSACCTNFFSTYPLPMSATKRSARVPGRKMTGGAFNKLLERLATEGVDISVPVDMKHYWSKHGTNRYITIK
ncbi:hypothetical protein L7F22_000357 [Adiantum nelumboides]|nr:hypothetical protein [Adiantum nelumboides]